MAEYIGRVDAIKAVNEQNAFTMTRAALIDVLNGIPAADVVEVVRCKDCYQSAVIDDVFYCTYWGKNTDENGYCHEGG